MERSRTEMAYELLKRHILDLALQPGQLVTEKDLIALSGCGRTPVREAMQRLQRDGLLRVVPFRGAFITEISSKDVEEIGQVRERLESLAAGLAARLMTPQEIAEVQAILDTLEPLGSRAPEQLFEADRRFHAAVIAGSRHKRVRDIITTLSDQIQRLRYVSLADPGRAARAHAEHRAIAAALAERDAARAELAMRVHLEHSQQSLLRVVSYAAGSPRTAR